LIKKIKFLELNKNSYNPYDINCLFKIDKYQNKKFLKVINKMKKKEVMKKEIGGNLRFGASCRYRDKSRDSRVESRESRRWERFLIREVEENIMSTLK
jgi:hypothetical protein